MDFLTLAKERYSVKKFSDRPLEPEKLQLILEAGQVAPTAANQQCQRIYVLQSKEALDKINGLTRCIYGAPTVLLMAYNADEDWKNPLEAGVHSGEQDVSIVATHIMLEAADLGVGSCWINYFPNTETQEAFGLPENEIPVLLMLLGYPAEGTGPLPKHFAAKPLEDFVRML